MTISCIQISLIICSCSSRYQLGRKQTLGTGFEVINYSLIKVKFSKTFGMGQTGKESFFYVLIWIWKYFDPSHSEFHFNQHCLWPIKTFILWNLKFLMMIIIISRGFNSKFPFSVILKMKLTLWNVNRSLGNKHLFFFFVILSFTLLIFHMSIFFSNS